MSTPPRSPTLRARSNSRSTTSSTLSGDYATNMSRILGSEDDDDAPVNAEFLDENGEEEEEFVYDGLDAPKGYRGKLRDALGEEHEEEEDMERWEEAEDGEPEDDDMPSVNGWRAGKPPSTPPRSANDSFTTSHLARSNSEYFTPFSQPSSARRSPALPPPPGSPSPSPSPSLNNGNAPTPPFLARLHPRISRLRSSFGGGGSPASLSPSTFASALPRFPSSSSLSRTATSRSVSSAPDMPGPSAVFQFAPLRRMGQALWGKARLGGDPTCVAVAAGVVCIGLESGEILVAAWDQRIIGVVPAPSPPSPITALAISHDHTHVASGHASGLIQIHSLPSLPSTSSSRLSSSSSSSQITRVRTVPPTTLAAVSTGRKEGHIGLPVTQVAFVGQRRTALVSADMGGRAFYWSLGKVGWVEATDVLRILGRYPAASPSPTPAPASAAARILALAPLPLGPAPHHTDARGLIAILTPAKLVVVGVRPPARTWWRRLRTEDAGEGRGGAMAWWPADDEGGKDPRLAWAWGRRVMLMSVGRWRGNEKEEGRLEFREEEGRACELEDPVVGLQWLDASLLLVLTHRHLNVVDAHMLELVEREPCDAASLVYPSTLHTPPISASPHAVPDLPLSTHSFRAYRGKIFLLTKSELRAGMLLSWADRVLSLVQAGEMLEAIDLATAYYLGTARGSAVGLPADTDERRALVGAKLRDLMGASQRYAFSEDRMRDGTHETPDGRGVDRTDLFEGLVGSCARACLALGDLDFVLDDLFDAYQSHGIESIFLAQLEPFVLDGQIRAVPPNVAQRLVAYHDEREQYADVEKLIWHLGPLTLDINQVIGVCQRQRLWDALVYVYTRALADYVSPIVEFLALVRRVQELRRGVEDGDGVTRTMRMGRAEGDLALVGDAYKLFTYLADVLSGLTYPSKEPLPERDASSAKTAVYAFLFAGRSVIWPPHGGGALVATTSDGEEPPYPYLRLLLKFDAEAFLDAMDAAFEDSYLNDDIPGRTVSRQLIVNLMLEVMGSSSSSSSDDAESPEFTSSDLTFLHIFVSRNLPKYPQFLILPPSTLHRILVSLAADPDPSTRDDRELAAESLLSTYTPHDGERMIERFERAGFFRILRAAYRNERKWGSLVRTVLRDPQGATPSSASGEKGVFGELDAVLRLARSREGPPRDVLDILLEWTPRLVEIDAAAAAALFDKHAPAMHAEVIERLTESPPEQFAYLQSLLEPDLATTSDDAPEGSSPTPPASSPRPPSVHVEFPTRHLYITLLSRFDPAGVVRILDVHGADFFDLRAVIERSEEGEVYDAVMWALDRLGETSGALDKLTDVVARRGEVLTVAAFALQGADELEKGKREGAERALELIAATVRMGVRLAVEHTTRTSTAAVDGVQVQKEELWFRVLHDVVELIQSVAGISEAPVDGDADEVALTPASKRTHPARARHVFIDHDDAPPPFEHHILAVLRALVDETLASLVSNTSSNSFSFPALFKRLVEASVSAPSFASTAASSGRAYAEFRTILTGMLDAYRSEGELLAMTKRLVERDTFALVKELKVQQHRGWRAKGGELEALAVVAALREPGERSGNGEAEAEEDMGRKGVVVLRSGMVVRASAFNFDGHRSVASS